MLFCAFSKGFLIRFLLLGQAVYNKKAVQLGRCGFESLSHQVGWAAKRLQSILRAWLREPQPPGLGMFKIYYLNGGNPKALIEFVNNELPTHTS